MASWLPPIESVTSNRKSESVSRCVFTWRTIPPNVIPIHRRLKLRRLCPDPIRSPQRQEKNNKMGGDMRSVPDLTVYMFIVVLRIWHKLRLRQGQVEVTDAEKLSVEILKRAGSAEQLEEITVRHDESTIDNRLTLTIRVVSYAFLIYMYISGMLGSGKSSLVDSSRTLVFVE